MTEILVKNSTHPSTASMFRYNPPPCDRLYLQDAVDDSLFLHGRCFHQDTELLRIEIFQSSHRFLETVSTPSITTLVVNFDDYHDVYDGPEFHCSLIQALPSLRHLQLLPRASKYMKTSSLDAFMHACAARHAERRGDSSPLTVTWVVGLPHSLFVAAEDDDRSWSGILAEMAELRGVLQVHKQRGSKKLGRLELYVAQRDLNVGRYQASELTFQSAYNGLLMAEVVPQLIELVDDVTVGGA